MLHAKLEKKHVFFASQKIRASSNIPPIILAHHVTGCCTRVKRDDGFAMPGLLAIGVGIDGWWSGAGTIATAGTQCDNSGSRIFLEIHIL